jgi:hypothetical protein
MSIDNVTIHQGYELPNGTNTLAHDVVRLINALTSIDSDVFLRPLASSSTYVGTTAIALNRASAAQALTGITSIDGSAATLTTSRTLWGQSFNGSANVTGNLTSVGNITGSGAISLTTAAASNLSLTSGTTGVVSLDSGTTGAINIGTGANTKTITIGSSTGTVQLPTAVTKVGQTFLIQGGAVNVTFPTLAGTLVGSGDTGSVTSTMILDGTILNADVNASAAIAGTKISPDFGSQNVTTTGTSTAASFIPSSATVPTNGLYLSAANTLAFSTNSTNALTIDSSQRVGIGTTSPTARLDLGAPGNAIFFQASNGVDSTLRFTFASNLTTIGNAGGSAGLALETSGTERARIDSSGRLLVGTSSARTAASYGVAGLQVESTNFQPASISAVNNQNTSDGVALMLGKSRGTTIGSNTIVQNGDFTGYISFQGADGTALRETATIYSVVDGNPGVNDMPGRLVFCTTADGSAGSTERMRIKSNGIINFSNAPTYADNTAATAGGLAVGDVYQTVLGVLMIRF